MIQVVVFACFALIRRWRDTFPTRGKASVGDPCNEDVTLGFGGSRYAYHHPPH